MIKKVLIVVAGTVAGAFGLVLLLTGMTYAFIWMAGLLDAKYALGIATQTSPGYGANSASLPVLVAMLGFSSIITSWWTHVNCEQPWCLRRGHPHPGHGRPVCTHHYHSEDVVPPKP